MSTPGFRGVVLASAAALALSGCASVVNGSPASPAPGASSTSPSPDNTPANNGNPNPTTPANHGGSGAFPSTSAGLAAFLHAGSAAVTSAHLTLTVNAAGETITASGDEQLSDGKSVATEITETVPGAGTVSVIVIGIKVYVKLPASLNSSTKPWTLITDNSSPALTQLLPSLQQATQGESLSQIATFIEATAAPKDRGSEVVNGVKAEHFSLSVDVTKLPDSFAGKSTLTQAGLTMIPIDLWVDPMGRTSRFAENLSVEGQQVSTVVNLTKYNVPVHITAPPANQVGNG